MWKKQSATLRFNFRGVGASEGEHDGGAGEADDAAAAVAFLAGQPGIQKDCALLARYLFGSIAAMTAAPKIKRSRRFGAGGVAAQDGGRARTQGFRRADCVSRG